MDSSYAFDDVVCETPLHCSIGVFFFWYSGHRSRLFHSPHLRWGINGLVHLERYCFWLVGANPHDIKNSPVLRERVQKVKDFRLASPKTATQKSADTPTLFQEIRQPETNYILIPSVSSENRRYVPIGFMHNDVISTNLNLILPNATMYHLGILVSNVHMAWMRTVCGRLKSDYRYSNIVVYNNFPWPTPTDEQRKAIEQTAQGILDARAKFPGASLADLYDETLMPPELRKAHQANDRAVMAAYNFPVKISEAECVAKLMEMYQALRES